MPDCYMNRLTPTLSKQGAFLITGGKPLCLFTRCQALPYRFEQDNPPRYRCVEGTYPSPQGYGDQKIAFLGGQVSNPLPFPADYDRDIAAQILVIQ